MRMARLDLRRGLSMAGLLLSMSFLFAVTVM
jgi:hypothetical protein